MAEAWRTGCFHQFHDILCGCAISVTYREAHERLAEVLATAQRATDDALQALAGALEAGAGVDPAIAVFNPLGGAWCDDVVRVPLSQLRGTIPAWLINDAGNRVPAQVSGDVLVFVAQDVPAFGSRVFRLVEAPAAGAGNCGAGTLG